MAFGNIDALRGLASCPFCRIVSFCRKVRTTDIWLFGCLDLGGCAFSVYVYLCFTLFEGSCCVTVADTVIKTT